MIRSSTEIDMKHKTPLNNVSVSAICLNEEFSYMIQQPYTFIYKSADMKQTSKPHDCPVAWYEVTNISRPAIIKCGGTDWLKYLHILCMIHGSMTMVKIGYDIVDKLQSNHRIKLDNPIGRAASKVDLSIMCLRHMETIAFINSLRFRDHMRMITLTCYAGIFSKLYQQCGTWVPHLRSIYSTNSYAGYLESISNITSGNMYDAGIVVVTDTAVLGEIANMMLSTQKSCGGRHRLCIIYIPSGNEFYAIQPSDYVVSKYGSSDVNQGVTAFDAIYNKTWVRPPTNPPITIDNIIDTRTPEAKRMFNVERRSYNGDLLNDCILKLTFVARLDYVIMTN